jgi:putative membrane protein
MRSCAHCFTRILRCSRLALLATAFACHSAPAAEAPPLSESDVAALVLLTNSAEVSYAQLAVSRTARPDVQAFAQRMATDHTSLNATFNDLLTRMNIAPSTASVAAAFRGRSNARRELLRNATVQRFDSLYAQAEIESHQELLQSIDQQLAPSVSRAELREYLAAFRPAVRAHLAHAEQVRATLAAR